jgi:hypothetical protein
MERLPTKRAFKNDTNRKRLIFVGLTADRVGWRCFDPIEFKFTTEYELLFDESSQRKRINALREYDIRRELQRRGKLNELELETDDFLLDEQTTNIERQLYSSPASSPEQEPPHQNKLALASGGASARPGKASSRADNAARRPTIKSSRGSVGESNALEGTSDDSNPVSASGRLKKSGFGGLQPQDRDAELRVGRSGNESAGVTEQDDKHWPRLNSPSTTPSDQYPNPTSFNMGSDDGLPHSAHDSRRVRTAPTTTAEDNVENDANLQPDIRIGPVPKTPSATRRPFMNIELTELDEGEMSQQDKEAEKYGPLTKENLDNERKKSKFDPRHPRRPLRRLPIGKVEEDTQDFQAFRKHALENDIMIKYQEKNPKGKSTPSYLRYERYKMATTLREVLELSMNGNTLKEKSKQRSMAMDDIRWDVLRGWILFPQHEHNATGHFMSAAALATQHKTYNIHQLYSKKEIAIEKRKVEAEEKLKLLSAFEKFQRDEQLEEIRSLVSLTSEDWLGYGFMSFHEQIESLWEQDMTLQMSGEDIQRETAAAAGIVEQLLGGDIPEPANYRAATRPTHPERKQWMESMGRERDTLASRGTWVMVPRNSIGRHRPVKCKYVYKKKRNKDGSLQWKSRLVACGYSQVEGVDYRVDETYAGVCSYSSMRWLMSLCCQKNMILSQTDITGAYLESYLTETVYMEPPPDMWIDGKPPLDAQGRELVCELKRGLYGLKQSGYHWSECFKDFLMKDES